MKKRLQIVFLALAVVVGSCSEQEQFSIDQLQGAWWAQGDDSPTAAFAIQGNEAWYDYDNSFHPITIDGDALVVDHGPERGIVRMRILSVENDQLVLQSVTNPPREFIYTRDEP